MTTTTPALDWAPRHDDRSRLYPARALMPGAAPRVASCWTAGRVLEQGPDGACVGYAFTAALAAEPRDLWPAAPAAEFTALAERAYAIAKTLDAMPGEAYSGTSVVAGAKAMKALDLIAGYRWAFGLADVVDALCNLGPVVLGLYWVEGMRTAAGGVMRLEGPPIGGHCTVAVAYDPAHPLFGGRPAIQIQNSWGTGWGSGGFAWIAATDLLTLLQRQGEACVVTSA